MPATETTPTPRPSPPPRRRCRACNQPASVIELADHLGCCRGCWQNLCAPTAGPADSYDRALAAVAR